MIDYHNLTLDNDKTWDLLCSGRTLGVFQLSKHLGQHWSERLKPRCIHDLAALSTLLRPGCLEAKINKKTITEHYVDRKNKLEEPDPIHEKIKDILFDTYGLIIYQEQQLQIAQYLAGFSLEEADILRDGIGKKKADVINKLRPKFIDGCVQHGGIKQEEAEQIYDVIAKSARYVFNKCLSPDTLVETPTGYVSLKDLEIGTYIKAPLNAAHGFVKVTNKFDNGIRNIYQITTESGHTIKCTMNHKFLCIDGIQRPLYDVLQQDAVIICGNFCSQISKVIRIGREPTLDIEVDHPQHVFYANDIAVSNSHSVEYAEISYWDAYIKANYPIEFFTATLTTAKSKIKPKEEIRALIKDAQYFNIKLKVPTIQDYFIDREGDFYIKNDDIYFGLINIKSIGNTQLAVLSQQIHESWLHNWYSFLTATTLNKSVVSNMILSGVLDCFGLQRKQMLYEFNCYNQLSEREQAALGAIHQIYPDANLIDSLNRLLELNNKSGCANKNRRKIVGDLVISLSYPPYELVDYPSWIYRQELELLGCNITYNLADLFTNAEIDSTCREFNDGKSGFMSFGVEINRVKEYTIKNGKNRGQKMGFMSVNDDTDSVHCLLFGDNWKDYKGLAYVNNVVKICGEPSKSKALIVKHIEEV